MVGSQRQQADPSKRADRNKPRMGFSGVGPRPQLVRQSVGARPQPTRATPELMGPTTPKIRSKGQPSRPPNFPGGRARPIQSGKGKDKPPYGSVCFMWSRNEDGCCTSGPCVQAPAAGPQMHRAPRGAEHGAQWVRGAIAQRGTVSLPHAKTRYRPYLGIGRFAPIRGLTLWGSGAGQKEGLIWLRLPRLCF